jgi:DNA repair exonuclease SbcCD ATPase subunit
MIIFRTLRYKNLLSSGNNWTKINFTDTKSTLVVGHNGAGKSTMLDALSFSLFGKPHRNIGKPQLVNSINKKDCIVEVEFSIGKSNFKVIRGAKPNIFEIWKDGVMVNQASHAREYQKILEQNILKLNHKSFHQIIVLGSSSFIQFMQLTSQHRRDVIEDLLDINIFSKMNSIIKEKNAIIKDKIREVTYEIDLLKEKIDLQRKYIREVENLSGEQIKDKEDEAVLAQESIVNIQLSNAILSRDVSELSETLQDDLKKANDKKTSLLHYQATFNQQIKTVVKEAKFFEENESCPTCEQDIDDDLRTSKLELAKGKAGELNTALSKANDQASEVEETLSSLSDIAKKVSDKQNDINNNNKEISRLQTTITNLSKAIDNIRGKDGDISIEKDKLQELNDTRESSFESRLVSNETLSYNIAMSEMLKDTGIKTKIIKQYLPVMNKLVNQYLQTLDFFVHFNLDENFQETIRSRHRDEFSYDSFSEGEKQRIDLALLFTWRMIAKMKNSVATNLLILDETFDSSLDHEGVDNLMKIIYTLGEETNVFVISHKGEILDGKFERKIEFFKEKNFSKIK